MKRVTRPVAVPVLVLTLLGLGTPPAAAEPSPVFPVAFITLSTLQLYPQEAPWALVQPCANVVRAEMPETPFDAVERLNEHFIDATFTPRLHVDIAGTARQQMRYSNCLYESGPPRIDASAPPLIALASTTWERSEISTLLHNLSVHA